MLADQREHLVRKPSNPIDVRVVVHGSREDDRLDTRCEGAIERASRIEVLRVHPVRHDAYAVEMAASAAAQDARLGLRNDAACVEPPDIACLGICQAAWLLANR